MKRPTVRGGPRRGAEKLSAFLKKHKLSYAAAGKELRVSAVAVWDWVRGNKLPNADHREAVETWTGGAVSLRDWADTPIRPHVSRTGTEG